MLSPGEYPLRAAVRILKCSDHIHRSRDQHTVPKLVRPPLAAGLHFICCAAPHYHSASGMATHGLCSRFRHGCDPFRVAKGRWESPRPFVFPPIRPRCCMAAGQNQWYHFWIGAPPMLVYFSGDWGCSLGANRGFDPWPYVIPPWQAEPVAQPSPMEFGEYGDGVRAPEFQKAPCSL